MLIGELQVQYNIHYRLPFRRSDNISSNACQQNYKLFKKLEHKVSTKIFKFTGF